MLSYEWTDQGNLSVMFVTLIEVIALLNNQ